MGARGALQTAHDSTRNLPSDMSIPARCCVGYACPTLAQGLSLKQAAKTRAFCNKVYAGARASPPQHGEDASRDDASEGTSRVAEQAKASKETEAAAIVRQRLKQTAHMLACCLDAAAAAEAARAAAAREQQLLVSSSHGMAKFCEGDRDRHEQEGCDRVSFNGSASIANRLLPRDAQEEESEASQLVMEWLDYCQHLLEADYPVTPPPPRHAGYLGGRAQEATLRRRREAVEAALQELSRSRRTTLPLQSSLLSSCLSSSQDVYGSRRWMQSRGRSRSKSRSKRFVPVGMEAASTLEEMGTDAELAPAPCNAASNVGYGASGVRRGVGLSLVEEALVELSQPLPRLLRQAIALFP
jgi:hypothetical protein